MMHRLGGLAETCRDLAYRLYTVCERKKWADEALAYNGLVIAWPELTKLALAERGKLSEPKQGEFFRLARQDEEGGLEGVLGVLLVPQQPPARRQHHWSVPAQQFSEGRPVPARDEASQQFPVGRARHGAHRAQ